MRTYYHPCVLLKNLTFELYSYDKSILLDNIFFYLDYVLCCNQHYTNTLTDYFKQIDKIYLYPKGVFPKFFEEFDQNIVKENVDRINDELDHIKPKKPEPIGDFLDFGKSLTKIELLDLSVPYKEIISLLKYSNDPIIEFAEYGYYVGCLLKIYSDRFFKVNKPNWEILNHRVNNFRKSVYENLKKIDKEKGK